MYVYVCIYIHICSYAFHVVYDIYHCIILHENAYEQQQQKQVLVLVHLQTTSYKYCWWLLATAECARLLLSLRVLPHPSAYKGAVEGRLG